VTEVENLPSYLAGTFGNMMTKKSDTKENKLAIWFSSILRWLLGLVFMVMGYFHSGDESTWAILTFGLIIFATGFIRPKRCIDDHCKI
jgi:hypothetical protein